MTNLIPSPAPDETHALLLKEVEKRYLGLKPERIAASEAKETERSLRSYVALIIASAIFLSVFLTVLRFVPAEARASVTDKEVTIVTLSAMAAGALIWVAFYIWKKQINCRMRDAVRSKEYTYAYAPTLGFFVVRFHYKNNLYRCYVKLDTPAEKECH